MRDTLAEPASPAWPEPTAEHGWLSTVEQTEAWLSERTGPRLALDVEADGMFRYRPRVCTIQLADAHRIGVVDGLAVPLGGALAQLLGDARVPKVVHDAAFDARMLLGYGAPLRGVFDTAVAVRYLGYAGTGLAAIVEAHFGVHLHKAQQQADWGVRPLDEAAMAYLHEDVRYLNALADALHGELVDAGIVDEFEIECDYVLDQAARTLADTRPPWTRVKSAAKLRPAARAVLRELAQVREALAEARDLPPGRLLPHGLLIALAERAPTDVAQVAKLLRRRNLTEDEHMQLADAVSRGAEAGDAPAEEVQRVCPEPPPPELRNLHKRRRTALMELRAREAERRGVDVQVVLPGHCIKDLTLLHELSADAVAQVRGLGACRIERYGDAILDALGPA